MTETKEIKCPMCGEIAKTIQTKYGKRNSCCQLHSWGDGDLATKETHKARQEAHRLFDRIWKTKLMPRTKAYEWLAKALNITRNQCHMKLMDCDMSIKVCHLSLEKLGDFNDRD